MPARRKGEDQIQAKIGMLIAKEGLTPKQAAGKAYGMSRGGDLGPAAKRAAGKEPARRRGKEPARRRGK
jgi:hypothetical protein